MSYWNTADCLQLLLHVERGMLNNCNGLQTQDINCLGFYRKCLPIFVLGYQILFLLLLRHLYESIYLILCWKALEMHRRGKRKHLRPEESVRMNLTKLDQYRQVTN